LKTTTLTKILALVLVALATVVSASAAAKANPRKGKALFKKNCRVCHDGKTEGTPALQPADLIADQWERSFSDEEDVTECVPRVTDKSGVELGEQDLLDIKAYVVDYAADSEQPATCG